MNGKAGCALEQIEVRQGEGRVVGDHAIGDVECVDGDIAPAGVALHVQRATVVEVDGGCAAAGTAGNNVTGNEEGAAAVHGDDAGAADGVGRGRARLLHGHNDVVAHDEQGGTDAGIVVHSEDAVAD